jgi:hypothetical protein
MLHSLYISTSFVMLLHSAPWNPGTHCSWYKGAVLVKPFKTLRFSSHMFYSCRIFLFQDISCWKEGYADSVGAVTCWWS